MLRLLAVLLFATSSPDPADETTLPPRLQPPRLQNGDFEGSPIDQEPQGWGITREGYRALVTDWQPRSGAQCVRLERTEEEESYPAVSLTQVFDGAPYAGKHLRLRAAARVQEPKGHPRQIVAVTLTVSYGENRIVSDFAQLDAFDSEWRYEQVAMHVPENPTTITCEVAVRWAKTAWFDDVTLEILDPAPLTPTALESIVAFTQLSTLIRVHLGTEQVIATDWIRFAADGVRHVELAADANELALLLKRLFARVAPEVRIWVTGGSEESMEAPDEEQVVASLRGGISCRVPRIRRPSSAPVRIPAPASPSDELAQLAQAEQNRREYQWREELRAEDRTMRLAKIAARWGDVAGGGVPSPVQERWVEALAEALRDAADSDEAGQVERLQRFLVEAAKK
ncbi:MAG: hypothetical protein AB1486_10145 [Planctomycetota bacterium]